MRQTSERQAKQMITWNGTRVTPNQRAKMLILEYGEGAFYWIEREHELDEQITEKERSALDDAIDRQWNRVRSFLGVEKIEESK